MHPAGIITAVLIIIAALLFWRSQWEKKQLSVEQYELRTAKLRKKVRLVFLSDLHDASFGERNQTLFRRIAELSPDAVLVGGDMITCGKRAQQPPRTEVCLHLMELLTRRFPVYYAEGNHENRMRRNFPDAYRIFTDHLLQMGVEYIRNGQEIFDTEDLIEDEADDLNLYGVSMEQRYFDALRPGFGRKEQMPKHYLSERLGKPDRQQFNILLMHSPLYLREAAAWGADLVLAGHFHGGTIRLPFIGGLMTPQFQFLLPECAGRFQEGSTEMIVSRGLGTHSIRIRLNDLPEISCIDILPEEQK